MRITNIYIPPPSSGSSLPEVMPQIATLLSNGSHNNHLILGDFNAHDDLWFSNIQCNRGAAIADTIEFSGMVPMNDDSYTRARNGTLTSP
nr:hypothetical protein F48B9.7 - Caenorhabditis elegans [Caenorhabditis elegans]